MADRSSSRVADFAAAVLRRRGIFRNPYFRHLGEGTMDLRTFRSSQEQFLFAVGFFSRPMAALIARIPDGKDRLDILHNLVEEHGDLDETQFHATTFQAFLRSIGSDPDQLETMPLAPAVRAFNSVLATACALDELEVGIGCIGIIELAFATISALIGTAVVRRGWVPQAELVHYKLHAELDQRHAREFFRVVEARWDDPARRYLIEQGLELGAYSFDRLYRDLLHV